MALTLSTSGITNSGTIQAAHVSQSIDALKGTHAYNLTPSGSFTFTGDTVFNGTISGNKSKIITSQVSNDSTITFNVNGDSTSTYVLTVLDDGNQGSNGIGFQLPRPATITPGTAYKIIIGLVGDDVASPATLARPVTIFVESSDRTALFSILTVNSTTALSRSSGPFVQMEIAASRSFTGDQYDLICDGTYWHVTGVIGAPSVTYSN